LRSGARSADSQKISEGKALSPHEFGALFKGFLEQAADTATYHDHGYEIRRRFEEDEASWLR
jgi:hypothetical protein